MTIVKTNRFDKFKWAGLILSVSLVAFALFLDNRPLIQNLNTTAAGGFGDGIKNYYTVAYHALYGESNSHFEGMNYPYGEHVIFTDNQPLLANIIRWVHQHIYPIGEYTFGIVNGTMLFSFLICTVFLYLIFIRLKLPWWYAGFFSITLTLMAPQMARFNGHYALSYACYIPILTYLLLVFDEKRQWFISLAIGFTMLTFGLLHLYYIAIGGFLLTAYLFFDGCYPFSKQKLKTQFVHFGLQIVLPFFLLLLWLKLTDQVTDRPSSPNGFLYFTARWESILLPIDYPLNNWINENITKVRRVQPEGIAYLGLVTALSAVILLLRFLFLIIKKIFSKQTKLHFIPTITHPYINRLFLVGFCAALFSCGLPFIAGLSWTLDYLGPLKQFRSIGRFAWITYFLLNISLLYFFYHFIFNKIKKQWLQYLLIATLFAIPIYETQSLLSRQYYSPKAIAEFTTKKANTTEWMDKINIDDYQAILPFPHFHIGSENFIFDQRGYQLRRVLIASLRSGLPLASCFMSRSSQIQTRKSIKWHFNPYGSFEWLNELPNNKPLLAWVEKEYPPNEIQQQYLRLADGPIFDHKDYQLFTLDPEKVKQYYTNQQVKKIQQFEPDEYVQIKDGIYASDSTNIFFYLDFEENEVVNPINKSKGKTLSREQKMIYSGPLPVEKGVPFEMRLWVNVAPDRVARFASKIEEYDESGVLMNRSIVGIFDHLAAIEKGWGLLTHTHTPVEDNSNFNIYIEPRKVKYPFYIDELLIAPKGVDVFWNEDDYFVKNNLWYPK